MDQLRGGWLCRPRPFCYVQWPAITVPIAAIPIRSSSAVVRLNTVGLLLSFKISFCIFLLNTQHSFTSCNFTLVSILYSEERRNFPTVADFSSNAPFLDNFHSISLCFLTLHNTHSWYINYNLIIVLFFKHHGMFRSNIDHQVNIKK